MFIHLVSWPEEVNGGIATMPPMTTVGMEIHSVVWLFFMNTALCDTRSCAVFMKNNQTTE